jgi:predicted ABC-type ATPase
MVPKRLLHLLIFLRKILACKAYINTDRIARGISLFQLKKVGVKAGRIMLKRIGKLLII